MRHYGDITKLSGYDLPVVDVITGGSPCQDLSVAGNREGLAGSRSGLFLEQIRIVKEMRERDEADGRTGEFIRPRFMVWENVPGSFTSNKGRDFQQVLTEIVRTLEPDAPDVPMPDKGRWPKAGCLYLETIGSIAWRVHDAQFWGTTQYVDGRMLIPGTPQRRKRIALVADFGGRCAPEVLFERRGLSGNFTESGNTREDLAAGTENRPRKASEKCSSELIEQGRVMVVESHWQDSRYNPMGDICETVCAKYGTGGGNAPIVIRQNSRPRRLMPLECERLQGFPDGWTDLGDWVDSTGKKHKAADSPRYRALGNSIALPFWFWLLRRIAALYERPATLGSLFDGIGGFPLCWERCNGPGTAIWASEIEEFCIAVTKKHFPEEMRE